MYVSNEKLQMVDIEDLEGNEVGSKVLSSKVLKWPLLYSSFYSPPVCLLTIIYSFYAHTQNRSVLIAV